MVRESATRVAGDIATLRDKIRRHDRLYYQESNPAISDMAYDLLYRRLQELESQHPELYDASSPTQRVGETRSEAFESFTHTVPMLSIDNCFDLDGLDVFHAGIEAAGIAARYAVEYKIDGIALAVTWEDGRLMRAVTRGTGIEGDCVTGNAKTIGNLPLILQRHDAETPRQFEVRGEVYIPLAHFMAFRAAEIDAGRDAPANPRNSAAGGMRTLNPAEAARRPLRFFAHSAGPQTSLSHGEFMNECWKLGISTVPGFYDLDWAGVKASIEQMIQKLPMLDIPIDGIVVKVDSFEHQSQLGAGTKYPKWARAYKWERVEGTTTVQDIKIQVGKSGILAPVAELTPVEIDGSVVSRASLFNRDEIARLDIRIGDQVVVEKAGKIIPHIVRVNIANREGRGLIPFAFPAKCPVCDAEAVQDVDGVYIRCSSPSTCPAQLRASLISYGARDRLDIDGLGPVLVDKLMQAKLLTNLADLYTLCDKEPQMLKLDGIGRTKVARLRAGIEASKERPLDKLLAGLNIRHLGRTAGHLMARRFGTLLDCVGATDAELRGIPGFGAAIVESWQRFVRSDAGIMLLLDLMNAGVNQGEPVPEGQELGLLDGLSIVPTGKFVQWGREEIKAAIRNAGGKPSSSVSKNTSFIVAGKAPGGKKMQKATELDIEVIDEQAFAAKLEFQVSNVLG